MVGTVPVPPRVRLHETRRPDGSCSAPCQLSPGPLGTDPLVYPEGLTADALPGVTRPGAVAARDAVALARGGVSEQVAQGAGKDVWALRRYMNAGRAVDHRVDQTANRGHHDWYATRHRLERDHAERLVPRDAHNGVGRTHKHRDLRVRELAEELDPSGNAAVPGNRAQPSHFGVTAQSIRRGATSNEQLGSRHGTQRLDDRVHALPLD